MGVLLNLMPFWARWIILAVFLASIAAFSAFKMHQYDTRHAKIAYDALQGRFDGFVADVKAKGEAARRQALWQAQTDEMRKETADAENATTTANLAIALNSLRRTADNSRHDLPAAPASSSRPDLACFDRGLLERGNGELDKQLVEGSRRIADKGTASTVGLDTARKWVMERAAVK